MREQTDSLTALLQSYGDKCEDYKKTPAKRANPDRLKDCEHMLKECEKRHEEMRLLNNRFR